MTTEQQAQVIQGDQPGNWLATLGVPQSPTFSLTQAEWEVTKSEIHKVVKRIRNKEQLQPADIREAQSLANKVRTHYSEYATMLRKMAKSYADLGEDSLNREGFDILQGYIDEQNRKAREIQAARVNEKISTFNGLVQEALVSHPITASTPLKELVSNAFMARFPNLNSGDKKKGIKDWTPISSVITLHLDRIEAILTDNPVITLLPMNSRTMLGLTDYLKTSNTYPVDNIASLLELDKPLLEDMVLRQSITSEDAVIGIVGDLLQQSDIDNTAKIERMHRVLTIWLSQRAL